MIHNVTLPPLVDVNAEKLSGNGKLSIWKELRTLVTGGFKNSSGETCLVTVDGTDFQIEEQLTKGFNRRWYSHKFNGPAVKYELAVSIQTGDIVWFCGPFMGAEHDLTVFRYRLKDMLLPSEKIIADKAYRGDLSTVTPYDAINAQHKECMGVLRARHETINRRFKHWGALQQKWRHSVGKHIYAFKFAIVMSQILHENGRPAFQVSGYNEWEGFNY